MTPMSLLYNSITLCLATWNSFPNIKLGQIRLANLEFEMWNRVNSIDLQQQSKIRSSNKICKFQAYR